jgi:hypothetical protein
MPMERYPGIVAFFFCASVSPSQFWTATIREAL